jgi:transmembrane sensor
MEPESVYDEVITRYLLNEAAPEEINFVLDWMTADEKNRLYVESLRSTLHLINLKQSTAKVNIDDEWVKFRNNLFPDHKTTAHFNEYKNPEWKDFTEEKPGRRANVFKLLIASSVAASVLFLIGLSAGWFSPAVTPDGVVVQKEKAPESQAKIDPLMAVVQHEVNTSGKTKQFLLPDGSEILLADSSELTYKEPANGGRRDVYLVGKADFKVVKNKIKPFTVFSEDISTTAIGTRFTVIAKEKDKFIQIRLYEGKVVIKLLKGYSEKWTKEIYLLPDQALMFDKSRKAATVVSFAGQKQAGSQTINQTKDSPSIPHYNKGSWFMFNNQSLPEIFDALAEMYDERIVYAKKDVKNMYFIGTYDKSDSLEKILKQITLLNNLRLTKQNDTFRIERQIAKKQR